MFYGKQSMQNFQNIGYLVKDSFINKNRIWNVDASGNTPTSEQRSLAILFVAPSAWLRFWLYSDLLWAQITTTKYKRFSMERQRRFIYSFLYEIIIVNSIPSKINFSPSTKSLELDSLVSNVPIHFLFEIRINPLWFISFGIMKVFSINLFTVL